MIAETITYRDYDGNERTDKLYFNLSKVECIELEANYEGGMDKLLEKIINEQDHKNMIEIFKTILLKAYGEKSVDGKYFRKTKEIADNFASTEAYTEMFMKLATDADYATKFINGILPEMPKEVTKGVDFMNNVIPAKKE